MKVKENGLDSFQLKLIALAFMLFDHLDIAVGYLGDWVTPITRFVAPLFAFLMVVGFYHTRDRKKYLLRLAIAGAIIYAGNYIIGFITGKVEQLDSRTIFFTLAACFALIWLLDAARKAQPKLAAAALYAAFAALWGASLLLPFEGAPELIPVAVIVYLCYPRPDGRREMCLAIAALSAAFAALMIPWNEIAAGEYVDWESFFTVNSDWMQFEVIPFICLYSGRPGPRNAFSKWMFYIVYPAHLWLFALIGALIGK